jgi:Tol biopolymer transport system component
MAQPIRALAVFVVALMSGCAVGPSGSASHRMTPTPGVALPSASAAVIVADNEQWIAFQWLSGAGTDGIFLVRPDGSGKHQLAEDLAGSEIHPDWSPDGRRIAFVRFTPEDQSELWVTNADNSGTELLFSCELPCNSFGYPDWSADGSAIYFSEDEHAPPGEPPTVFQFMRFDLVSKKAVPVLTRRGPVSAEQPRIAPDDSRVVYARYRETNAGTQSAIFVCDLQGGRESQLTEWAMNGGSPDWSTSGVIAFNTYDLGIFQETIEPANLFTINPDGSALTQLTHHGPGEERATQPRWAPDGSGIIFTRVAGPGMGARTMAFLPISGPAIELKPSTATHSTLRPIE